MYSIRNAALGFSLIELMTALAVASVLLVVGVPSFRYVTNANRIAGEINGLLGDLQLARSEAIEQGRPVTICRSVDGATCAAANTWQSGWIVFMDANGNQTVERRRIAAARTAAHRGGRHARCQWQHCGRHIQP